MTCCVCTCALLYNIQPYNDYCEKIVSAICLCREHSIAKKHNIYYKAHGFHMGNYMGFTHLIITCFQELNSCFVLFFCEEFFSPPMVMTHASSDELIFSISFLLDFLTPAHPPVFKKCIYSVTVGICWGTSISYLLCHFREFVDAFN